MTARTTKARRDELRRIADAATPGPWTAEHMRENDYAAQVVAGSDGPIADLEHAYDEQDMTDATFIAEARTAVPALLDEVDRLEAALRKIEELANEHSLRSTVAISQVARRALGEGAK
jgi:hypothetical protein